LRSVVHIDTTQIDTWMRAHLNGDPKAFGRILESYKGHLWGYLVNHVQRHQDAEDLFQEINLKVLENLGKLRDPSRFRSWLFSIAMNSVRSFYRKVTPFSLDGEDNAGARLVSAADGPQKTLEKSERTLLLRRCIQQLPERDRQVVLLNNMAELAQQDIADQLNLNLNTVKTIIRRARIKLARMMAEVTHG